MIIVRDGLPVDSGYHAVSSRMGISNKYVSNAGSLDMPPIHERTISRVYLGDLERNTDVSYILVICKSIPPGPGAEGKGKEGGEP